MIDMLKRHEIQVLRRADHTWNEIATLTGVSVSTAQRVVAEDVVADLGGGHGGAHGGGRPGHGVAAQVDGGFRHGRRSSRGELPAILWKQPNATHENGPITTPLPVNLAVR